MYIEPKDDIVRAREIQHGPVGHFGSTKVDLMMAGAVADFESSLTCALDRGGISVPAELEAVANA
jgi:hypothetical protein